MNKNSFKIQPLLLSLIFFFGLLSLNLLAKNTYTYSSEQKIIFDAFGWDFNNFSVRTQKLNDQTYVLYGYGGNILVSIGEDGVLMVDDQFPDIADDILDEVKSLGGSMVDVIINTHWHFDHSEGNRAFGPKGALIIAQENSRDYMINPKPINMVNSVYPQQPYKGKEVAKVTFKDSMTLHFNNEHFELLHYGPAHTTGDAAIYLKNSNILHLGDVLNTQVAYIDSDNGGSIDGMIHFMRSTLKVINAETIIVPGHGEVTSYNSYVEFINNLESFRGDLKEMIGNGNGFIEIAKNNPAIKYSKVLGDPVLVLDRAYASIMKNN
jgi:cyclase